MQGLRNLYLVSLQQINAKASASQGFRLLSSVEGRSLTSFPLIPEFVRGTSSLPFCSVEYVFYEVTHRLDCDSSLEEVTAADHLANEAADIFVPVAELLREEAESSRLSASYVKTRPQSFG